MYKKSRVFWEGSGSGETRDYTRKGFPESLVPTSFHIESRSSVELIRPRIGAIQVNVQQV